VHDILQIAISTPSYYSTPLSSPSSPRKVKSLGEMYMDILTFLGGLRQQPTT
jgi:hypothetical protein